MHYIIATCAVSLLMAIGSAVIIVSLVLGI